MVFDHSWTGRTSEATETSARGWKIRLGSHGDSSLGCFCITQGSSVYLRSSSLSASPVSQKRRACHRCSSPLSVIMHSIGGEITKEPHSTNTQVFSQKGSLVCCHHSEERWVQPQGSWAALGELMTVASARVLRPRLETPSTSERWKRNKMVHSLIPFSHKLRQLDNVGKEVTDIIADETVSFGFIFVLNGCLFLFSILCCLV